MAGRLLVVSADPALRQRCREILGVNGNAILLAASAAEGADRARAGDLDVALVEAPRPRAADLDGLRLLQAAAPDLPVILLTPEVTGDAALEALRHGAIDLLPRSAGAEDLLLAVGRAVGRRRLLGENRQLLRGLQGKLEEQAILMELGGLLSSTLRIEEILDLVMKKAQEILRAEASSLMLVDEGAQELYFTVARGEKGEAVKEIRLRMGEGIAGWVAQTGEAVLIPEAARDPRFSRKADEATHFETRSILCAPVKVKARTMGVVQVLNRLDGRPFEEKDLALLSAVAAQAGIALENARLYAESERQNRELTHLLQASQDLSSTLDLDEILDRIAAQLLQVIPAARTGIILLDEGGARGQVRAGAIDERLPLSRSADGEIDLASYPEIREVIRTRQPLVIPNVLEDPLMVEVRHLLWPIGLRSLLVVPLLVKDQVFGVVKVAQFGAVHHFSGAQVNLCRTIANQASIAIENARLYEQLQRKNAQLERANQHKSEFLAKMSHELRTPMNAIIGFSELLLEESFGPLNPRQGRYIENIHESGKDLLGLINSVLDISKIEAGKMEIHPEPFDLPATITAVLGIMRPLAAKKGIGIDLDVAAECPILVADQARFRQILYNLLSNAIKFTPEAGRVQVAARPADRVRPEPGDGGPSPQLALPCPLPAGPAPYVEIAVSDTGIGIAPEDQERIFESFQQIDGSLVRQYQGTGLGLSLVKAFVELHGGAIWVESAPGNGSTFAFTLPLAPSPEAGTPLTLQDEAPTGDPAAGRRPRPLGARQRRTGSPDAGGFPDHALHGMADERDTEPGPSGDPGNARTPVPLGAQPPGPGAGDVAAARAARAIGESGDPAIGPRPSGNGPATILVVDDVALNAELLRSHLLAAGYSVRVARDGEEALRKVQEAPPDLILLDVMMPKLDGYEVCRRLKGDERTMFIPVVMITALKDLRAKLKGIEAGADDFLSKPFNPVELGARVRSLLRLKQRTDELEHAEAVLCSLALSVESKDPYTEGHCERLSRYSVALGRALGLAPEKLTALHRGGILHDLGKIAVSDVILRKPGPLTEDEWRIMREHPIIGERICLPLRTLRLVLPIIRHHHERWDGSGYPDGLAGEAIPLTARILQVADIFDALSTQRPYKPALPPEEALRIMREEAARGWWDGRLVEAFAGVLAADEALGRLAEGVEAEQPALSLGGETHG